MKIELDFRKNKELQKRLILTQTHHLNAKWEAQALGIAVLRVRTNFRELIHKNVLRKSNKKVLQIQLAEVAEKGVEKGVKKDEGLVKSMMYI